MMAKPFRTLGSLGSSKPAASLIASTPRRPPAEGPDCGQSGAVVKVHL